MVQPQHVMQRGNNRQVIFAAEADYQFFLDAPAKGATKYGLTIHAYVWMTNDIHLLGCLDPGTVEKMNVTQFDGQNWEHYYPSGRAVGYPN